MEPKYMYSESTVRPPAFEEVFGTVYLRKGFTRDMRDDGAGGTVIFWTYQEAAMPRGALDAYAEMAARAKAVTDAIGGALADNSIREDIVVMMGAIAGIYEATFVRG